MPGLASWINSESNVTVFICSFAWMFVLSALISIIMFGKERRHNSILSKPGVNPVRFSFIGLDAFGWIRLVKPERSFAAVHSFIR